MLRWTAILVCSGLALASPQYLRVQEPTVTPFDVKVPVQLGVMSQDPDAVLCHRVFDLVRDRVGEKMNTTLVYVADLDDEEPDLGVRCEHGRQECIGDIQQLCTAKYAPDEWWHFVHCQNFQGSGRIGSPEVAYKCARAAGFDWNESGVGKCADLGAGGMSAEGVKLLQENVRFGKKLGIEKSCTILINSEQVCVHDGIWRDCDEGHTVNDFVRQINELYDHLNS